MTKKTLLLLLSFCQLNLLSQGITGKVIDSLTMEPIPFTHIYTQSGLGTISNENGNFALNIETSEIDTLFLSHVGYSRKKILANTISDKGVIFLNPLTRVLKEIVVYDREYTEKLIDNVYNNLRRTDQANFGKAFYRQVTSNNNEPTEIHEIFFTLSYSSTGIKKYYSKEARYAKKNFLNAKPIASMANQLLLTLGIDIAPTGHTKLIKPFNENYKSEVNFVITDEYSLKNEEYIVVSFQPNKGGSDIGMKGSITIDKKNNCICRYQATTSSSLGMDTLRSKTKLKNALITNHRFEWDIGFNCYNDDNPSLIYSIVNTSVEVEAIGKIDVNSKLVVYENERKKEKKLKEYTLNDKDLQLIKQTKYRPNFWKNNSIIKRTPLEERIVQSFEASNSFGTYFLK